MTALWRTYFLMVAAGQSYNSDEPYEYVCIGECGKDASPETTPGVILMGGGSSVGDAFKKHIEWSGGGDFLVIKAVDSDSYDYNPFIQGLGTTNSVATFVLKEASAAEDPFVLSIIDKAEAIWFAGGHQSRYIREWMGSSLQHHVQAAVDRGVPIGGTSAGCDIQSGFVYTAIAGSVHSEEALANPYDDRITVQEFPFVTQFGGLLSNALAETHFVTRDRMGRHVAMLARLWQDGNAAYGIGIDEKTAIAIDASGVGTVLNHSGGGGTAYVVQPSNAAEVCENGTKLVYRSIPVQKLTVGDTFDFAVMKGGSAEHQYTISVVDGQLLDPYEISGNNWELTSV